MLSTALPDTGTQQWQAYLTMALGKSYSATRIKRIRHLGPLYVQKPFYPEGPECAHVYLLHPPGGLVSGDNLQLNIDLDQRAHSLITTPGAARMYKARNSIPLQQQIIHLHASKNAIIEWLPMEAIVYPKASAKLQTLLQLEKGAHCIAWELTCFGLPASAQPFEQGQFSQKYRIDYDGVPVFIDRLQVDAENNRELFVNQAGLQQQTVSGFMVAGPFDDNALMPLIDQLRAVITTKKMDNDIAITHVNDFLVVRYLGDSAYQCRKGFVSLWQVLRPELLGRPACEPRIWLT